MSESIGRSSPRVDCKSRRPDGSRTLTPEKKRFEEDVSPVSLHDTSTSSDRSSSARCKRHHRKSAKRDARENDDICRSHRDRDGRYCEYKRRKRYEDRDEDEEETSKAQSKHSRLDDSYDRDDKRGKESEGGACREKEKHRRGRKRSVEREEKRGSKRRYKEEREGSSKCRRSGGEHGHASMDKEDKEKRSRRRSRSQNSPFRVSSAHNDRSSPSTKQHLNPFVSTLLKPLTREDTSDTEFEEFLPVGFLSGELAKRSMPLPADLLQKVASSQPQQKQSPDQAVLTGPQSVASTEPQKSVEDGENRFDNFLSRLSTRMQEQGLEPETWKDREIDFSELLTEEKNALRLAASTTAMKQKQLLESSLCTPWQGITEKNPEDVDDEEALKLEAEPTEDKGEQPVNLVALASMGFSRRFLGDRLARELESRGLSLPPATGFPHSTTHQPLKGTVPTIFGEIRWRQSLLGIIHA
ncbi:unnamed protein product [Mesocestoides corti]|uniref:SMAP domain-containing protein n=1 Tax=Mesocestoides corti TaxID=53468 RepID=A0A0R3UDV4_MESCO|nr:unnamed protein product [Mesocestoides corti]